MQKVRLAIVAITIGIGCMVGVTQTTPVEAANNGTLKVHEKGTPSGTESNDPKVCSFNFEGFGFDASQTGYVLIEVQGGSAPVGQNAGPFTVGPANQDGYFESVYFNDGAGPTVKNGTYKATLYGKQLPGGELQDEKAKSKVFKVNCQGGEEPQANIAHRVACVLVNSVPTVRVILTNTGDSSGNITVNGEVVTVASGATVSRDFASGTHVTIVLNGQTVYDAAVRCTDDETPNPEIDFDLVCDAKQKAAVITFSNSGNADGTVTLNDEDITVLAGVPVTRTIPTGTNGVGITIEIDGKVVFKQLVNCQPGKGGGGMGSMNGNGTSPSVTDTKQLPNTAGETDQVAMTIVGSLAAAITLAGVAVRSFLVKPF